MTWLMDKCDYALTDGSDFFSEVEQIIYGQIVITGDQTGVHFRSEALLFRIQNPGAESGKPVVKLLVLRRLCVVFAEQVIISCGHTVSQLVQGVELVLIMSQRALSRFEIDAGHPFVGLDFIYLNQTHRTAPGGMSPAAGYAVRRIVPRADGNDGDIFIKRQCFSERKLFGFFAGIEPIHRDREILPDDAVRLFFRSFSHFPCHFFVCAG